MDQPSHMSMRDFETIKQLGSGSFGRVKLVKKNGSDTLFALKTVSISRLSQKDKDAALNEVRLLASISIPTVIKYEGSFFDMESQQLCLLMQYADGGDLQKRIIDRQDNHPGEGFEQKFIWKVALEILSGLKTLHKNHIIHRDIKSANIFFVKGVAKLGDLNVSKLAEGGFCSTQTGTPYYTSPEVWSGQKYTNKCDIWSLGCILYELCTLKVPFKASDFPSLYRKITKGEYVEISSKYSEKMKGLVRMCLTVEEEMRPSAAEMLQNEHFHRLQMNANDINGGQINMMNTIRCPKVLRLLNARLPKVKNQDNPKKTVNFASKKEVSECVSPQRKQNVGYCKVRSQKAIKWSQQQQLKGLRPHMIKLPPVGLNGCGEMQSNGHFLMFKKLKTKAKSAKFIRMDESDAYEID